MSDSPSDTRRSEKLLLACRKVILHAVNQRFTACMEALSEKLFEMSDKAGSNQEQVLFFEARRAFEPRKSDIAAEFLQHLYESFKKFERGDETVSAAFINQIEGQGNLSLVENDALEEAIALSTMSRKAESRNAEALYALNKRLAAIRGGKKISMGYCPIEPAVFAEALKNATQKVTWQTKPKLVAFKFFEKQFMDWIGKLYDQLNSDLIAKGILKNLRYDIKKARDELGIDGFAGEFESPEDVLRSLEQASPDPSAAATKANTTSFAYTQTDGTPLAGASGTAQSSAAGNNAYAEGSGANSDGFTADQQLDAALAAAEARRQHVYQRSLPIQQQLLDAIQQIQGARIEGYYGANNNEVVTIALPYTHREIIDSLNELQVDHIAKVDNPDAPILVISEHSDQLRHQLETHYTGKDRRKKSTAETKLDADVIEIVGMMFEYMLNEPNLPDSAKALISYLHTPYLKLALLEKEFFEHPQHPARVLLNSLVEAGERWLEPKAKNRNAVFAQMRNTVHRVLKEFKDNNSSLFSELAFDFSQFLRKHERRVHITENRAQQAAKGEDRLREIRLRVTEEIDKHTTGKRIPQPVLDLLYEPWSSYMSFILLRYGPKSDDWEAALKLIQEVIWFIEPKQSWVGKEASGQMSEPLENLIRKGFEVVGYDTARGEVLIKSLHLCRRLSVEGIKDRAELAPIYEPEQHVERATPEQQKIIDRLSKLEFGTWFLFDADDKKNSRVAKLAWYNANTQHYMFVNKLGHQTAVRTALDLAKEMELNKTKILKDDQSKPFFEKALERVLDQLNKSRN